MAPEEDFILTISDNEELPISDLSSSDSAPPPAMKKRKRDAEPEATPSKKTKLKSKKKNKNVSSDEEESDVEQGKPDGAIDPDFEFDFGGNALGGVIEDFDGWEAKGAAKSNGDKKGVDIDDIIARRREKKGGKMKSLDEEVALEEGGYGDDDDGDGQEGGDAFPDLDDDELLATDAFGGGVDSEEEDKLSEDEASDADDTPHMNGDAEPDSDDDSIASPTAHPDDIASAPSDSDTDSQTTTSDVEERAKRAAFFAPDSEANRKAATLGNATGSGFTQFSLSRPLLRALASLSFTAPTPIQTRCIPLALQGLDLVGSAVTGSGKTAAFLLPILERLLYRPRRIPTTRVAILMPTRELAVQCHSVAVALARFTDITFAQLVGGFSLREQEALLKRRPDVVIATPGRFIDHMRNSASFSVETLEILVLDEADRMLEDGFADELNEILKTIPRGRQTMLFSATMTESVDKLVRVGMNRPVRVSVDARKATTEGLIQEFVRLRPGREGKRLATLALLCQRFFKERTIVFFRQKKEAHRVRIVFGLLGIKAGELHGSMSQEQRIAAVSSFREGRTSHLLATDLASRGLDIKNVAVVVNYEAPQSHEIYVHRVGRTARAGREGRACTIAAEPDRKVVKAAVKSARGQGAKVVSRVLETKEVDAMDEEVEGLAEEIEEVLEEEKQEKQMQQADMQLTKGENMVKHEKEIMGRPQRTWFESEKEKRIAKKSGRAELNGPDAAPKKGKAGGKLSGKDKKRLDDRRERLEGNMWRKGKGSEEAVKTERKESKSRGIKKMKKGGLSGGKKGKAGKSRR